ncbi:MAG: hypothetical protein KDD62_06540 [Bdellovibrionales bacterium]|nr:hypothetical protein [Bdellovibrionales bacterium]
MNDIEFRIPALYVICGFIALVFFSLILQRSLRKRHLRRQGQVFLADGGIASVEMRLANNPAWKQGVIFAKHKGFMLVLWLLFFVWELTFGSAFFRLLFQADAATSQRVILGFFSALGLIPLVFAIRATLRHFRFGYSTCIIDGKAGVIGSSMKGRIQCSSDIQPTGDYKVALKCVEHYETGAGKNRRTKTKIHWQASNRISAAEVRMQSGIPFEFSLPTSVPETASQLTNGEVQWQLEISAPVSGVDYLALFVIPVFKLQ